ncbi:C1 family peptidase [uncultured Methanobrevibacter sp.]|uniref:C1 family peptidase n=1 Tax=uncultured Methanobrevibacter sp. TaxID=253161 RepID=UPI002630210B|nr:C1 family peptidase [uncultured Methanobrevibacter sp.]
MKLLRILIVMLILILSMGAVCATDSISDDVLSDGNSDTLQTTQNEIYTIGESKTFTELDEDIQSAVGVLDIQDNYKFNNGTDNSSGITINKDNFVINGNGYTIDGNNQSRIFIINGTNITINNLTFINANFSSGSVFKIPINCSLTTTDVILKDNAADWGIIYVLGQYSSNNDKITDSTVSSFGVITLYYGASATFNNAFMMNSKKLAEGFIYALNGACLSVSNSTFTNTTSKYTTAISGNNITKIKNSKFINLHANVTAGAIGLKDISEGMIDNCTFINVTSQKNGGAIFADVFTPTNNVLVLINNSNFVDCYSGFGGAILQLGGMIIVDNCNFTRNSALFDGGAIYTSYAGVEIVNSKFEDNQALYEFTDRSTSGGAIFCDFSNVILNKNILTNNSAQSGGAVYLYDSLYTIENNTFNDNLALYGSYQDIFTVFDQFSSLNDNNYSSNDSLSLDNVNYATIVDGSGMKIVLINNPFDVSTIPSRFDLRDWGWVTLVRDQEHGAACWAFGSSGAMESAILRYLGLEMDISENNMQDVSLQYYMYGVNGRLEGATLWHAAAYALSWLGVFSSEYDSYDQLGKISPIIATEDSVHFQDVVFIPVRESPLDNNQLKESILKYGALAVAYYAAQTAPYCNIETGAQYCNVSMYSNHAVTLIGWDDTYSAENFLITPPGNGAWIIKNSWGENVGDEGYFYISYYDPGFASQYESVAFLLNNTVEYNMNYQYDINGDLSYCPANEYVNFYVSLGNDLIAAVGTYFNETGVEYNVEVYVNEVLMASQNGVSPFAGFHTIQLDSFIPIKKGDEFAVKITSNAIPIFLDSRQHYIQGSSQYLFNGSWVNASDMRQTCSIKVYTVRDKTTFADLNETISSGSEITLEKDYTFDNETDFNFISGIEISNRTLIIDGANHTIDAAGQARIFKINSANVVIKNLIVKNAINGAISAENSNITTINVQFLNNTGTAGGALAIRNSNHDGVGDVFINNTATLGGAILILSSNSTTSGDVFINNTAGFGGAIVFVRSNYESNDDLFINNYADKGAAIYSESGIMLKLNNGSFVNGKDLKWSLIYLSGTAMLIENTTFANITSNYSTAIHSNKASGIIKNCDFINLTAKVTAGAIGVKTIVDEIIIENCNFFNTSSDKNGGAVYMDTSDDDNSFGVGNVTFINSQFIDCVSGFGGAYVQLGGGLAIDNTNFTSNIAVFDGGAIYASNLRHVNISNSRFISNHGVWPGYANGGAAYFDNESVTLDSCIFENNTASEGSSIYAYQCELILVNNYFNNPTTNSSSIYTLFDKGYVDDGNNFTNDVKSLNNTDYDYDTEGSQEAFAILNNTLHFDVLPDKFDLRDYGWVSPVRDQGNMGACWTFGAMGALESALIRYANITYDFSENNMQDTMIIFSKYGSSVTPEAGNTFLAVSYLISWLGISPSDYDSYDELGKLSPVITTSQDVHITDVVLLDPRVNSTDNEKIKDALVKFGVVMVGYWADPSPQYYNSTTYAYYYNASVSMNHIVAIVGWDDNYSASNFALTPPGDGAFIVKNSWGESYGDNGYFYVSYYDTSFGAVDFLAAFDIKNNITYDMIYQQELGGQGITPTNYTYYMNKYIAEDDSLIAAVGTIFVNVTDYEFSVLVNGVSVYNQSGVSDYEGYSTIKLSKCIPVKKGDEFAVIFKNIAVTPVLSRVITPTNVSFGSNDGVNWEDLSMVGSAAILKVYTILDSTKDLEKYYSDDAPIEINVNPGEKVTFEINGISATVVADENGTAKLGVNLDPGTYYLTVKTSEYSVTYPVEIKSTIDSQDVVVGYNSDYNYKIQLLDAKGKALSNTSISVTINGKTNEFTTDDNGSATINFTKLTENQVISVINPVTGEVSLNEIEVIQPIASKFANITLCYGNLSAILLDINDCPIANATIFYKINGIESNTTANGDGAFVVLLDSNALVDIIYLGDNLTAPANVSITVNNIVPIRSATVIEGNNFTQYAIEYYSGERGGNFTVQLKDASGKVLANKTVLIGYNGKCLERTTDENGFANVQINLVAANRLTFAVAFLGDENYDATMSVYLITIVKKPVNMTASSKTYKASAKTKSYTVSLSTIPGVDGKTYFAAGKKVTMRINGVTYTAKTNDKGQATFKINITKKGIYAATVAYAGDNTYESVSKNVKITIN